MELLITINTPTEVVHLHSYEEFWALYNECHYLGYNLVVIGGNILINEIVFGIECDDRTETAWRNLPSADED